MIVVGTAGHIDHGKSAIVKRLTGTDPDRLPEEKARGMTIDLGFAFYESSGGESVALVDVPGHERFVRNMIAGAGGIDAVMLVIAADDGWMPQSEEHFQITRLLGLRDGFIVINKTDLVEPDWLDLLEQDVRDKVVGTFLANAPLLRFSAQTGSGFEDLADYIDQLAGRLQTGKDIKKARLYIDRSFVRPGMGGVVTGTLRGGSLSVGQLVGVWPSGARGKIRTLQSNNQEVRQAAPGQRTAVSLTGVEKELLVRGGVITERTDLDYFRQHPVLALSIEMLADASVAVRDRRRLLLIIGTTEVEGEVRLFERKEIGATENGLVFFKPDRPVYTLVGDHFIVRLPTPMVTVGGGRVLDHLVKVPRRRELPAFAYLLERLAPEAAPLIISELKKQTLVSAGELLCGADYGAEELSDVVTKLIEQGVVGKFGDYLYHVAHLNAEAGRVEEQITAYLKEHPHLKGLSLAALEGMLRYQSDTLECLLEYLVSQNVLSKTGELYNPAGRGMSLKGVIKDAYDEIISALQAHPYDPPKLSELVAGGKVYQQAVKFIIDSGEGYKCGTEFLFLAERWREVVAFIKERIMAHDSLMVSDLRDRFDFTRKYAIPILEETDRLGLTARQGDVRVKGERFENEDFTL
jgi:selenocysteine-specific elongation factor